MMKALPNATVHGLAFTGASIKAPARIAANQNSASVAAASIAPRRRLRKPAKRMSTPAKVAAPIGMMLLII